MVIRSNAMKKKPIALLLTDTHLKTDNVGLVSAIWEQAVIKCDELGIKIIYFLADFFTTRNAQPLDVLEEGLTIVKEVQEAGIHLIGFPGNHDKVDLNSEKSYLDMYAAYMQLVTGYYESISTEMAIYFIPYFKEDGKYKDYLQHAILQAKRHKTKSKKHILLTHIAVNGVMNNDGTKVENNLKASDFKVFDSVFVGHYHNQSKIGNNIYYIGSAYQANYGEDSNKGFTILYSDGSHEFIKSEFPEYIKLTVDISDEKKIKEVLKKHSNSQDNVRIVFEGDDTQLHNLNKAKFNSVGIDVKFNKEIPRQDLAAVIESNVTFDRSNIDKAFKEFCKQNGFEKDIKVGLNYLNKLT